MARRATCAGWAAPRCSTPGRADGGQDLSTLEHLSRELGVALQSKAGAHLFVIRSTDDRRLAVALMREESVNGVDLDAGGITVRAGDYGIHAPQRDESGEIKTGAFETFEAGRDGANVSCACHWATSAAASGRAGQLVTSAYSVAPCAIMVAPESPIRRPEDLAEDVPPGDRRRG